MPKTTATKAKTVPAAPAKKSRKLRPPKYASFRLHRRIQHPKPALPGAFRLLKGSFTVLFGNWKLFGGIIAVYTVLSFLLVQGFGANANITELKDVFSQLFTSAGGKLQTGVTLFGVLLTTVGQTSSEVSSAYQSLLLIIVSLAVIWALRQVMAGTVVGIRDAFYKGMYPIVPFLLVLLVIALQLLPWIVASLIYQFVIAGQIAVTVLEVVLWGILCFLLGLWSLYMTTSSVFALYIVTLPDVRPLQALRTARGLVRYRRWTIMRKVLFLPFALLLVGALIMVPIILFITPLAQWVFLLLTMSTIAIVHAYMYSLYRELIA